MILSESQTDQKSSKVYKSMNCRKKESLVK